MGSSKFFKPLVDNKLFATVVEHSSINFTFIFGTVANLPSEGAAPYALMTFAGVLPWQFFATALTDGSNSLTANSVDLFDQVPRIKHDTVADD